MFNSWALFFDPFIRDTVVIESWEELIVVSR